MGAGHFAKKLSNRWSGILTGLHPPLWTHFEGPSYATVYLVTLCFGGGMSSNVWWGVDEVLRVRMVSGT